jgi:hypothetical protein
MSRWEILTGRRVPAWLLTLAFGAVILLSGGALDVLVQHHHETLWSAMAVSDYVAALVASVLFYRLILYERERRRAIRRRLEIIAEINHHVRNAVYVISLSTHPSQDVEMVKLIQDSLKRIDWALKEILPKL